MAASETINPNYDIQVNGVSIPFGIRQFIKRVEYESADGMADVAKIIATNPDDVLSNAKVFQPGNEISIYMGYGSQLKHIGRVGLVKQRPQFPQDGMPMLTAVGYTRDHEMMDNAPEKSKKQKGKGGRHYREAPYSEAVFDRASDYGMSPDIDTTKGVFNYVQKVGLKDYEFVQGLANLTGFIFWVDGDENGVWTLHFRDPERLQEQDREFTFNYKLGDLSSILSFTPEMLIKDFDTKIKVQTKALKTGLLEEFEIEESNDASPDVEAAGDPTGEIDKPYSTASDIKLYIGDFSFDFIGSKKFRTSQEVLLWARQWFRRMRENFILANGKLIGTEELMARQTHTLKGLGTGYDGKYYFTRVRHIVSDTDGYICEFNARKVVPPVA